MGADSEKPAVWGGVRVFSIGGRLVNQRERLLGMTDEERRWRAQFLKDQILSPDEPRFSPEYYKATNNIFVRLFRKPMDLFQKAITPLLGEQSAATFRIVTGKLIALYIGACVITYYIKYNKQDWTSTGGWDYRESRARLLPGDLDYPNVPKKENYEHSDTGFSESIFW